MSCESPQLEVIQNHLIENFLFCLHPEKAEGEMLGYIQMQIDQGFDLNSQDEYQDTLLHWTIAELGDSSRGLAMIDLLIRNGADLSIKGESGETPLFRAVSYFRRSAVKLLLENGADPNAVNEKEDTALIELLYDTDENNEDQALEIVKLLVEAGADIHFVRTDGTTTLTAGAGSLKCCQYLIEQGVDIHAPSCGGNSNLAFAVQFGDLDTIKLLLKKGADSHAASEFSESALEWAAGNARNDSVEIIQLLLDAGAEIDRRNEYSGGTALMAAAGHGSPDNVKLLIDAGADVNAADQIQGMTPLMYAAEKGRIQIARMLVDAGAEKLATDKEGKSALDYFPNNSYKVLWMSEIE